MFWLVRAAPAHMLRLQNGHFDAPDRLFGSIQESWQLVNSSSTDVKVRRTARRSASMRSSEEQVLLSMASVCSLK